MQKIIFTDGASRGNPGRGGWGAIIVDNENIMELGGFQADTTNNRMELTACINALGKIEENSDIIIYSDSSYVINGITKWVRGWIANGWMTKTGESVLNKDLWQSLVNSVSRKNISWKYVGGHSGVKGNERCDVIATCFADGKEIKLFDGKASDYSIKDILDISVTEESVNKKNHSKAKAYSYISMVNGDIQIHSTWAECEKRVKGVKGALFKKSTSLEQEGEIIKEFKERG